MIKLNSRQIPLAIIYRLQRSRLRPEGERLSLEAITIVQVRGNNTSELGHWQWKQKGEDGIEGHGRGGLSLRREITN